MTLPLVCLPLAPLAGVLAAPLVRSERALARVSLAVAGTVFVLAALLGNDVRAGAVAGGLGLLYADALAAYLLVVVATVGLACAAHRVGASDPEPAAEELAGLRRTEVLRQLALLAVITALLADHLAVLWLAFEAASLVSGFLIGRGMRAARPGVSWSYFVVSTVAAAASLIGTALVYGATVHAPADLAGLLGPRWSLGASLASEVPSSAATVGLVLLVLGYGARAGVATLSSWLAAAQEQMPARSAASWSGMLPHAAIYALLRLHALATTLIGPTQTARVFVGLGLVALLVVTPRLLARASLPGMLADSTFAHLGLALFAVGAGGSAVVGGLLHLFNHAVAKTLLWLASAALPAGARPGADASAPPAPRSGGASGLLLTLGALTLAGLPPSGMFLSGFIIFASALSRGQRLASSLAFAAAAAISIAWLLTARELIAGGDAPDAPPAPRRRAVTPANVVLLTLALASLALGLAIPFPLASLVEAAAKVLGHEPAPLARLPAVLPGIVP